MDLVEEDYNVNGVEKIQSYISPKLKKPFFIGVSGGTASGKVAEYYIQVYTILN